MGNVFFGIVGGEPFMHPHLLEMLADHPDCYFQVFTNGQFITDESAKELRQPRQRDAAHQRRGQRDRQRRTPRPGRRVQQDDAGVQNCLKHKVFTGVCTSLCQTNIDDLLTEKWVDRLIEMGVMYTWFHVYRPMGPDANPQLCLTPEQQLQGAESSWWRCGRRSRSSSSTPTSTAKGRRCARPRPASRITSIPWGDIEPCPIMQFTKESIHPARTDDPPAAGEVPAIGVPARLPRPGPTTTRGCIVLERPDLLKQLVEKHGARDSTARGTALAELEAMEIRTSQYNPGSESPGEKLGVPSGEALLVQRLRRLQTARAHASRSPRRGEVLLSR